MDNQSVIIAFIVMCKSTFMLGLWSLMLQLDTFFKIFTKFTLFHEILFYLFYIRTFWTYDELQLIWA